MKQSTMIGIIVILALLVGIFLLSPLSPLNKVSVDGEGVKLPTGYSVVNTTKSSLTISNDTNTLCLYPTNQTTDLNKATKGYQNKYKDHFNVSIKKLNTSDSTEVYKTVATPKDKTATIYWFNHKNKTYHIRTEDAVKGTDDVALKIISSMN